MPTQRDNRKRLQPRHPPRLHPQLLPLPPHPAPRLPDLETRPPHLDPLLRHLRHSQQHRHHQQHSLKHPRPNHHDGAREIPRDVKRQHVPLPLQGQPVRPHVRPRARPRRRGRRGAHDPQGQLRPLRDARLPDHFRVLQPPAADRALAADIGGGGGVGRQGQRRAVPGPGRDAALQHAAAPVGVGPVQSAHGQRDAVEDPGGQGGEGLVREQFGEDGEDRAGVWGGWGG